MAFKMFIFATLAVLTVVINGAPSNVRTSGDSLTEKEEAALWMALQNLLKLGMCDFVARIII